MRVMTVDLHIFSRANPMGGGWKKKVTVWDAVAEDRFGTSVAISGDRAIVGAWGDDDNGEESGSAYLFTRQVDGRWRDEKVTAFDGVAEDRFGLAVAISGNTAVVGAPLSTSMVEVRGLRMFSRNRSMVVGWKKKSRPPMVPLEIHSVLP